MTPSSPHTDDAVGLQIARAVEGDQAAFRSLVEAHYGYASAIARNLLPSPEDVEDAVQESFIRVWKHLRDYDGRAKFTTWLHAIVTRLCYDRIRSGTRRMRIFQRLDAEGERSDEIRMTGTDQVAEESDLAQSIVRVAHKLPHQQRIVFLLRDVEDRTIDEIADALSINANAVRVNLFYARKRIRQQLQDEG